MCSSDLLASGVGDEQLIGELFQATLSRNPAEAELAAVRAQLTDPAATDRADVFQDLFWALLNSREFAFQH